VTKNIRVAGFAFASGNRKFEFIYPGVFNIIAALEIFLKFFQKWY